MAYINGEASSSKIRGVVITTLFIAVLVFAARVYLGLHEPLKAERESFRLGTIVRLEVWGENRASLNAALDASMAEIARLESLFSVNISISDISRINSNSGGRIKVSPETGELIALALKNAGETGGAFDPTIGPVVRLWGIGTKNAHVPADSEIDAARELVDYRRISCYKQNGGCYVAVGRGQRLDLGGIAKGWIADRVADLLRRHGITSALIDLGGNLYVIGKSPKGHVWKIGLQHPDKPRGEYFCTIDVEDISVVTSGPYERYFEKDGVRYNHIFDPSTGRPVQSGLVSVSVISKSSADADALCTAMFVMGPEKSVTFLREHMDLEAVLVVGAEKKVFITQNIENKFSLTDGSMMLEVINGAVK